MRDLGNVIGSVPISDDETFDVLSSSVVVVNRASHTVAYYSVWAARWYYLWTQSLRNSSAAPTNAIDISERNLMIGGGKYIYILNHESGNAISILSIQRGDLVSINITDDGYIVAKARQPNATYLYGYRFNRSDLTQLWDYSRSCESLEFTFVDGNIVASAVSGVQTWFVALNVVSGAVLVDTLDNTGDFRGPLIGSRAMVYIPGITAFNVQGSWMWARNLGPGFVTYSSVLDVLALCPTDHSALPGVNFLDPLMGTVVGSVSISFSKKCLSAFSVQTQVTTMGVKTLMFVRVQAWNGTSIVVGYQYGYTRRSF